MQFRFVLFLPPKQKQTFLFLWAPGATIGNNLISSACCRIGRCQRVNWTEESQRWVEHFGKQGGWRGGGGAWRVSLPPSPRHTLTRLFIRFLQVFWRVRSSFYIFFVFFYWSCLLQGKLFFSLCHEEMYGDELAYCFHLISRQTCKITSCGDSWIWEVWLQCIFVYVGGRGAVLPLTSVSFDSPENLPVRKKKMLLSNGAKCEKKL